MKVYDQVNQVVDGTFFRERIKNGVYKTPMAFPKRDNLCYNCKENVAGLITTGAKFCCYCSTPLDLEKREKKYRDALDIYRDDTNYLENAFKKDALESVGYANHPKADRIFSEAWNKCHSYGHASVLNELEELANFLDDILN